MKVGIQLYSVRNHMASDPIGTLREVAADGYRYIEAANHNAEVDDGIGFGVSAKELKKILHEANVSIVSTHVHPMRAEAIGPVLEYQNEINSRFVVMQMDFYKNRDEVLRKAEALNRVGEKCTQAGITLLYHNHFHEFQLFDDESVFDIIMQQTDPALVKIELDTYWAMRGGMNPTDVLEKYGERVCLIHQKDFPAEYKDQVNLIDQVNRDGIAVDLDYFVQVVKDHTFTEIGTGLMDIQSIINKGNTTCHCEYIILEQDYSVHDEMESIRISMDSFMKYNGIEW